MRSDDKPKRTKQDSEETQPPSPKRTALNPKDKSSDSDQAAHGGQGSEGAQPPAPKEEAPAATPEPMDESPSSGQAVPGGSDSDKTSKAQVSVKKQHIIVSSQLGPGGGLILSLNDEQRHDTHLSSGQGDHITAYVAILQAIVGNADAEGISTAIQKLENTINSLLTPEERKGLPTAPNVHTHEQRQEFEGAMAQHLPKSHDMFSEEVKCGKLIMLGAYMNNITDYFLQKMQNRELTTCYSKGREDKDTGEGAYTKDAARAIMAFEQLCQLSELSKDPSKEEAFDKCLKDFTISLAPNKHGSGDTEDQHVARNGISVWHKAKDGGTGITAADNILKKLNSVSTLAEQRQIVEDIKEHLLGSKPNAEFGTRGSSATLHKFIGDLYDYGQNITFDLNNAIALTKAENEKYKTHEQCDEAKLEKLKDKLPRGHECEPTGDSGRQKVKVTRSDLDDLYTTLYTHRQVLIAAFPQISKSEVFEKQFEVFLQAEVLDKQEWSKHRLQGAKLTKDDLLTGIGKKAQDKHTQEKQHETEEDRLSLPSDSTPLRSPVSAAPDAVAAANEQQVESSTSISPEVAKDIDEGLQQYITHSHAPAVLPSEAKSGTPPPDSDSIMQI